jgi:hypothetical protein
MAEDGGGWELFVANYGVGLVMALLGLAIGLVVFFSVMQVMVNRKANLKSLMGAGILLGIFLLAWLIAPRDFKMSDIDKGIGSRDSGLIGGGLITVYILMATAFVSIAFFEVKRAFKK